MGLLGNFSEPIDYAAIQCYTQLVSRGGFDIEHTCVRSTENRRKVHAKSRNQQPASRPAIEAVAASAAGGFIEDAAHGKPRQATASLGSTWRCGIVPPLK